jgi:hypothetical protein
MASIKYIGNMMQLSTDGACFAIGFCDARSYLAQTYRQRRCPSLSPKIWMRDQLRDHDVRSTH